MSRDLFSEPEGDDFAKAVAREKAQERAAVPSWPAPLGPAALTGLAGDIVRTIEPNTESDPAAILFQLLAAFGSIIGRGPHWRVENSRHYTNLFVAVVGDTSKARKGTSLDRVRYLFNGLDPEWEHRIQSGLSSGEGLIWFVRDPLFEPVAVKENGRVTGYEPMQTDAGEKDKRALIIESEFARVLNVSERQGNTLSPIIRDAWDGRPLGTMTKSKAARCSEPHISIIGHVTRDELGRALTDTAVANGFANRFLFVCARRSKLLPFGGDEIDWTQTRVRLRSAINNAQRTGEVPMDSEARELWPVAYDSLSPGSGGLFDSVTARAEAQVRRLALLYALLDESPYVRANHLHAGLEAWRYCEDSCRAIFGDSMGDPTADAILAVLQKSPLGMTSTELSEHFQRNKKSEEIKRALDALLWTGKVRFEEEKKEGARGRSTKRWFLV